MNGIQEITRERMRQQLPVGKTQVKQAVTNLASTVGTLEGEGYYSDHDDQLVKKELIEKAIACLYSYRNGPVYVPHDFTETCKVAIKHNKDPRRLLIIAGALIAAEIDRIDRRKGS